MSTPGMALNNRYRLEQKIGEGGFAEVFLATDLELDRQVAVKLLSQTWARDQEFSARFRNEARAIAMLDHPNILPIYDFGVAGGAPYLVSPFVSGGTLADRMKQRLTLEQIADFLQQMAAALDYAHERRVVHRDIKPSNILVHTSGRLLLTDFGLAKLLDNSGAAARTQVLGTVAYMAPEQFQGLVSSASDIYALGVVLYEMVVGQRPYEGNTREVLMAHFQATATPLAGSQQMRQVPAALVQALDLVLQRALAKNPADRYPSCQALSEAYQRALRPPVQEPTVREPVIQEPTLIAPPDQLQGLLPATLDEATQIAPPQSRSPATVRLPQEEAAAPAAPTPPRPAVNIQATEIAPPLAERRPVLLQPARLVVTTEPDQGFQASLELTGERMTLGREPDNQLAVPLSIVSRRHAVIERLSAGPQGPHHKIVDLGSVNRLYVQGREVREKVLAEGDCIEIGMRGFGPYIVRLTYHGPVYS